MNQPAKKRKPSALAPGVDVGGYVLKERLGAGGFGTVFLAEQGGERLAVKLIPLAGLGRWGVREVVVLSQVRHPHAARLRGYIEWPPAAPRYLAVMMDYVEGRRLDVWTRAENPSARQVARLVLGVARALEAVHEAKALHRDVKEANIVVREPDGEAVLVDFGVGTYEDTSQSPRVLPPGTRNYLSPEAWRFFREQANEPGGGYVSTPADDVYALGVTLYWLLTDVRPFEVEESGGIDAVIGEAPTPPHVRNPRVPVELGELCLRLLAKAPEERPDAAAVGAALEALLAREGAAWEEPLCDSFSPHNASTEPGEDCDGMARWRNEQRHAEERPRRGVRPFQPVEAPPSVDALPAAQPPAEPPALTPEATTLEVPPHLVLAEPSPEAGRGGDSRVRVRARGRAWAVGAVLAACVGLGTLLAFNESPRPAPAPVASATRQEVAPPGKPPDSDEAAAPPQAVPTPAAVASHTTPPKETASVKTQKNASKAQQPKKDSTGRGSTGRGSAGKTLGAAVAACALATGCSGAQVRPTSEPPPEPCPPGAVEAMEKLGIRKGHVGRATFFLVVGEKGAQPTTVTEGPVNVRYTTRLGDMPNTSTFSGRLIFGERVYGRFTRARSPDGTLDIPVCLEAWDPDGGRGLIYEGERGPTTATVFSHFRVRAVRQFE